MWAGASASLACDGRPSVRARDHHPPGVTDGMQGMARRKLSPPRMPSNRYLGRQWSGLRCSKSSSSHFAAASQPGGSLRVLSRVLIEPRRGGRLTRSKKAAGIARCGSPGSKIVCLRKPTQPRSAQLRPHFDQRKSKYAVPMQEQKPCCCLATALDRCGPAGSDRSVAFS
jgi:hypothetical protein